MPEKKTGLFWFTNDLRLHDNPALMRTNSIVDELVCVYISNSSIHSATFPYAHNIAGEHKNKFLLSSLDCLSDNLNQLGQKLHYLDASKTQFPATHHLIDLINELSASDIFRSNNAGWYENQIWRALEDHFPQKNFYTIDTHTLFQLNDFPFSLSELPSSFTKFKNKVSQCSPIKPIIKLDCLPPAPSNTLVAAIAYDQDSEHGSFNGGENTGITHVTRYFAGKSPAHYKEVRNSLDGWDNSCKLSPWLANGSLSVREVVARLHRYEQAEVANESTYWIYFELLWREYFQWYAHKHGRQLFRLSGIKGINPLNSYYPERFQKWVNGTTPFPIVNACMNELRSTGFLSNRGRQIVASCFVNELAMDWRYGAAYFESVLIDYDVASNWGNWQYLAGVGADTRDKRHFNLDKQIQQFDPERRYITLWHGDQNVQPLDSTDAADWPIN